MGPKFLRDDQGEEAPSDISTTRVSLEPHKNTGSRSIAGSREDMQLVAHLN